MGLVHFQVIFSTGRFFRTVPALFLYYLTARSCTDVAFLVATGPTPGLCRGVETGPGVALVWDKWSRTSAETPSQNRFWTLGGPMEALGHPTLPLGTPGSSLGTGLEPTRAHRCGWGPDWGRRGPTGGTGLEPTRAQWCGLAPASAGEVQLQLQNSPEGALRDL